MSPGGIRTHDFSRWAAAGRSPADIVGSNPTGGHGRLSVVSVVCCQVEVSADEMISRPEESYRLCCVVVCDLENLKNEEAMTRVGSQRHQKKS